MQQSCLYNKNHCTGWRYGALTIPLPALVPSERAPQTRCVSALLGEGNAHQTGAQQAGCVDGKWLMQLAGLLKDRYLHWESHGTCLGCPATLGFHRAQTAPSPGKVTLAAAKKEDPTKSSGSSDLTEMPH